MRDPDPREGRIPIGPLDVQKNVHAGTIARRRRSAHARSEQVILQRLASVGQAAHC